jgi:hypothetical protein
VAESVLQAVVAAWMKEKADYTYGPENNACTAATDKNVHHYTQVLIPARHDTEDFQMRDLKSRNTVPRECGATRPLWAVPGHNVHLAPISYGSAL